jgi:hypothetical protein
VIAEIVRSAFIIGHIGVVSMLVAVNLDNQFRCEAAEVGYIRTNRNLSPEVAALQREPIP